MFRKPFVSALVGLGLVTLGSSESFALTAPNHRPACGGATLKVGPVPAQVRRAFNLAPFYKKHVSAGGLPVVSSAKVSDAGLREAAYLINHMLAAREDVRKALIKNKVRFAVMAQAEVTTDIPEHSDLTPKAHWDTRARGLGATTARPAVSCGEENLLNFKGDVYDNENILVHEFAHAVHEMGLNGIDTRFDIRLKGIYDRAMKKGLWKNTYAATNHREYWAEGVQSYFDCNAPAGGVHNDVNTREKLSKYDPELFKLIDETFQRPKWRYVRYDKRQAKVGAKRVTVKVVNDTKKSITVYRVDAGKLVRFRTLAAGERYEQPTFSGQTWRAVVKGRRAAVAYEASKTNATWRVR
jgi:alpha-glucosidase